MHYIYVVYVSQALFLNNQYDGGVGVYTATYWCGDSIVQKQKFSDTEIIVEYPSKKVIYLKYISYLV